MESFSFASSCFFLKFQFNMILLTGFRCFCSRFLETIDLYGHKCAQLTEVGVYKSNIITNSWLILLKFIVFVYNTVISSYVMTGLVFWLQSTVNFKCRLV